MADEGAASITPKYLIGAVTKLTGLSIDVVRVWERRYGAVRPARSGGGTRLYSDADVLRLRKLRQAVEQGHSISQAAKISESELDDLIRDSAKPSVEPDPYRGVRDRFMSSIQNMEVVAADLELTRAAILFTSFEFLKQVVAPLVVEVGERCAQNEFTVANERLASGVVRNVLCSLFRLYRPSENAATIVMATPADERRELGLLLAAVLAATHGWRVIYVGADLPASAIAHTVRATNAQVLSLSLTTERRRIVDEVEAISKLVPTTTRVWITGEEAVRHREQIDRANWVLVRDLDDLDNLLRNHKPDRRDSATRLS